MPLEKNNISEHSKDLLKRLLQPDPDKRIDWETFFNHPLFKNDDDDDMECDDDYNIKKKKKVLFSALGEVMKNSSKVNKEFDNRKKEVSNKKEFVDPL